MPCADSYLYNTRICTVCGYVWCAPADLEMLCPTCHCGVDTLKATDPKPPHVLKMWEQRCSLSMSGYR